MAPLPLANARRLITIITINITINLTIATAIITAIGAVSICITIVTVDVIASVEYKMLNLSAV